MTSTLFLVSCNGNSSLRETEANATPRYVLPVPPVILTDRGERTAYMAGHYWQGVDYADTAWLTDSVALEQIFVQWVTLLVQLSTDESIKVAGNVISQGNACPALQLRLAELAERYFHDPNSPYRNEELYIPVLRAVIAAPGIGDIHKERPRYQLEKALMNRPGTQAADFAFVTKDGRTLRLSDIRGNYVLLYFFNPDCHDCKRVTAHMAASPCFTNLLKKSSLTLLAIYPDEDLQAWKSHAGEMPGEWTVARYADSRSRQAYDLPAIPNLYLLDHEKKVVLKDAPVERIEEWLKRETRK